MWVKVVLYQNVNFDNYLTKMIIAIFFQNLLRLKVKGQGRNTKKMNGTFIEFYHIEVALLFTWFDVPNKLPTKWSRAKTKNALTIYF